MSNFFLIIPVMEPSDKNATNEIDILVMTTAKPAKQLTHLFLASHYQEKKAREVQEVGKN